ncbi:uncharacterized [Tachysurus ichikawai]
MYSPLSCERDRAKVNVRISGIVSNNPKIPGTCRLLISEISSIPRELLKALCSIFPQALALNTASSHKAEKKPRLPAVRHRFTPTDVRIFAGLH